MAYKAESFIHDLDKVAKARQEFSGYLSAITDTLTVIAQLRRNAGFSHFLLGENPLKAHNARFLAGKEPKMVEKRAVTTNLPRLSNYLSSTPNSVSGMPDRAVLRTLQFPMPNDVCLLRLGIFLTNVPKRTGIAM